MVRADIAAYSGQIATDRWVRAEHRVAISIAEQERHHSASLGIAKLSHRSIRHGSQVRQQTAGGRQRSRSRRGGHRLSSIGN